MANSTRAGWRLFACEDCRRVWWSATRDRYSASVEGCSCGCDCRPLDWRGDPKLKVDAFANLAERYEDKVIREGEDG